MKKLISIYSTHTKEKLTATIFILLIFVMFFGMFLNPRGLGGTFINTYRTTVPTDAPYMERIYGAIDAFEATLNENAFQKESYIELYGLSQTAMNKKVITDSGYGYLYKTPDDQIVFAVKENYILDSCTATYDLVSSLESADIDFVYVQLPYKIAPDKYLKEPAIPEIAKDFANKNADYFLENMEIAGVNYYDLRPEFWESGMTQNQLFYNTDHHWTIEAAFASTGYLAKHLNENYGLDIDTSLYEDYLDESMYNAHTRKDDFIGSMGRRVGKLYGGTDDFTLITPKFKTDYTLSQIDGNGTTVFNGSFEEAILTKSCLTDPDITANRYAAYHGDNEELRFVNNLTKNNDKVLIIKDSFGIPVYSFLSMGVKEIRAIDLRLFKRDVLEYAKEYNPDIVILMYNADSFNSPMFEFNIAEK